MTENKVEGGEDMTENTMVECNECGTEYDSEQEGSEYNDAPICDECSRFCERCESTTSADDCYMIGGRTLWCETCRDNHAFYCNQCNEYYDSNYVSNHYFDGSDYCEDCINEVADWCEHCDEWEHGNRRCEDYRRSQGEGASVHQYSYKPDPIFLGKDKHSLYMGWELEADTQYRTQDQASAYASNILEQENNLAYLKADGSVSRGFEIVTHPIAHNELRGANLDPYWDTIERLRAYYNFRSWDSEASCGLHIHLSRKGFSNGAHLHRFLQFIYRNPEMMMKFAGRKSDDYATFQDIWKYDEYDRPYRTYAHKMDYVPSRPHTLNRRGSTRGSAVNTNNEHTIELRFFRGTLNKKGILACLDMAHAGVEYTRLLNTRDVVAGMLSWDMFYEWVSDNNGIYPELYDRMPKCRTVDIKNRVMLNA